MLLQPVTARKRFHQPLARYSSFRIGGPADALVLVEDVENLKMLQAIAQAHDIPLFVLGGGSNLLIRDGGIRGIVIAMRGAFRAFRVRPHADATACADVYAGVGCSLSRLALQLAQQSWSGLEFAYGIPGTLGGAMIMNAGTYLGDLSQALMAAQVLLASGEVAVIPSQELGLRYRGSSYPAASIVLEAALRVQLGDRDTIEASMRESNERRQRTQPLWLPNAGSIFKNPPGAAAARLIDELGLKGTRIGGAMVSPVHANFLVNVDHARAADVEALMQLIRERVYEAYGIELEPEVRVVGEES
jgi:UDP-N-acetylmuramate dehydrogenase